MLVPSRTIGETIKIGDDITIMVTDVRGKHVKLGINAPKELEIIRLETDGNGDAQR